MLKIRKNDEVVVIAGRDKGQRGEVLEVKKDGRLIVSGINMVKKHKKATKENKGGIITIEGTIHLSNLKKTDEVKSKVKDKK